MIWSLAVQMYCIKDLSKMAHMIPGVDHAIVEFQVQRLSLIQYPWRHHYSGPLHVHLQVLV